MHNYNVYSGVTRQSRLEQNTQTLRGNEGFLCQASLYNLPNIMVALPIHSLSSTLRLSLFETIDLKYVKLSTKHRMVLSVDTEDCMVAG